MAKSLVPGTRTIVAFVQGPQAFSKNKRVRVVRRASLPTFPSYDFGAQQLVRNGHSITPIVE